jgi:UDP-glucose 4-epimerase
MARILITGGSGFIGSAIARELASRGDEVWAFDIACSPALRDLQQQSSAVRFLPGEISEWHHVAQALREVRPDSIIHCAAIVGVVASANAPFATFRVNVEGALNLLEAMRLMGAKRLINLSTEEIYGHFRNDIINEDHPCLPVMPYGISKFAVEQLARDYARMYYLECIHLRTCWTYGPGLPRARVPKILVDAAVAGKPMHLPSGGDFRVDHVYIDDLVAGVIAAIDKPQHRYDAYHIASGVATPLSEIVAIVTELVPGAELSIGPGEYRFDERTGIVRKGALDISRARDELGYAPRYDIRAGLRAYINAQRAELARGR